MHALQARRREQDRLERLDREHKEVQGRAEFEVGGALGPWGEGEGFAASAPPECRLGLLPNWSRKEGGSCQLLEGVPVQREF